MDRNNLLLSMEDEDEVALRKESVDRNTGARPQKPATTGRSPQGERG